MQKVRWALHRIDSLSEWTGKVMSFLILFMIGIITYEVIMRYVFNAPTIWAHETTQYLFGPYFIIGGAYALKQRAHTSMDIIYNRLSIKQRAFLDLVTSILFFFAVGLLLWYGVSVSWGSLVRWDLSDEPFQPPIFPIKLMIPIGALLLLLQGLAKFVRDIAIVATGQETI